MPHHACFTDPRGQRRRREVENKATAGRKVRDAARVPLEGCTSACTCVSLTDISGRTLHNCTERPLLLQCRLHAPPPSMWAVRFCADVALLVLRQGQGAWFCCRRLPPSLAHSPCVVFVGERRMRIGLKKAAAQVRPGRRPVDPNAAREPAKRKVTDCCAPARTHMARRKKATREVGHGRDHEKASHLTRRSEQAELTTPLSRVVYVLVFRGMMRGKKFLGRCHGVLPLFLRERPASSPFHSCPLFTRTPPTLLLLETPL